MTITELSPDAVPLLAELRKADWLNYDQYKKLADLIARNEIQQAADLLNAWAVV